MVMGLLACERRSPSFQQSAAASPEAIDTVVLRVPIVYRRAYMIQRVTPALHPLQALLPLDTELVVRIYDQRGVELNGVHVEWTLAGDHEGGTLHVINGTTDRLGLSRATYTPGPSADKQGAIAEIPGLGRIEFLVEVPVNTIRVAAAGSTWVGDTADVSATLIDYAGNVLRGGELQWSTSDTSTLRVASASHTTARIRGIRSGRADVVAWVLTTGVRGYTSIGIRPIFAGRFVTADGGAVPAMKLSARVRGAVAELNVESGAFSRRLEVGGSEEVEVDAEPRDPNAGYHAMRARLPARELASLTIALVPTRWRIDAGTYRGQTIAIDPVLALQRPRSGGGASFWRFTTRSESGRPFIPGWRDADFPLKIAFDRAHSHEAVSSDDSVRFWRTAAQVENDLGMKLFTPAMINAAGVVPVEIRITAVGGAGHTFVTFNGSGDQYDGSLSFPQSASLRDEAVVAHELLHLLGFGHTSAWPTIAEPTAGEERKLTVQDVAYAQVALRLRQLQERNRALAGLPY